MTDDEPDIDPRRLDPCTEEATRHGCTCTMSSTHSASIDPPEPVIAEWCPLHGRQDDPDARHDAERNGDFDGFGHYVADDF